jgi:hypothetical protein
MSDISKLDALIADNVREFELGRLRRRSLSAAEREKMLTETLGPEGQPVKGETFAVGDAVAGVTPKSVWFQSRRIHFATIVSIAVGELRDGDRHRYSVDVNCTLRRTYRINVATILDADNFLVALAQFMSFKIAPTVEEQIREEQRAEEAAAVTEADAARRHRRMEQLAIHQRQLLAELIQVECAPRISFGVIY